MFGDRRTGLGYLPEGRNKFHKELFRSLAGRADVLIATTKPPTDQALALTGIIGRPDLRVRFHVQHYRGEGVVALEDGRDPAPAEVGLPPCGGGELQKADVGDGCGDREHF